MKKLIIPFLLVAFFYQTAYSQTVNEDLKAINNIVNSHATEELNNQITSFVRVVADHLTNSKTGYALNVSLIAFKDSSKWFQDTEFLKSWNRFLRNTQLSGGVTKTQQFNDVTAQLTFAILNRRDSAIYVLRSPVTEALFLRIMQEGILNYQADLKKNGKSDSEAKIIAATAFATIGKFSSSHKITDIDPTFNTYMNQSSAKTQTIPAITFAEAFLGFVKDYNNYAKSVQRRSLWTIYPYASYNLPGSSFDKAGLGSTFLVSLDKNVQHKPWQLDIEIGAYVNNDSTKKTVNTDQHIISGSLGLNKVLAQNTHGESTMELSLSGKYQYNYESNVTQNKPTLDLTYKIQLLKNLWIPLTLSYDSNRKGNFLGYVNITVNLNK